MHFLPGKSEVGTDATAAIEVVEDDEVSVISSKTQDGLAAAGGIRVASDSTPPVIGLTANATPAGVPGQVGSVDGRPGGK